MTLVSELYFIPQNYHPTRGCVPKLAQHHREIVKKGIATEFLLASCDETVISVLNTNSLELRYYSKLEWEKLACSIY